MSSRFGLALACAMILGSFHGARTVQADWDEAIAAEAASEASVQITAPTTDAATKSQLAATTKDAKSVFVVVDEAVGGDFICTLGCNEKTTVGCALDDAYYPHPIDFSEAKIVVSRPLTYVNDDLTIEAEELLFHINWDAASGKPTAASERVLQPGDRVIVSLPAKADAGVTVPAAFIDSLFCAQSGVVPIPTAVIAPAPYDPPDSIDAIFTQAAAEFAPEAPSAVLPIGDDEILSEPQPPAPRYGSLPADGAAVLPRPIPGNMTQVKFAIAVIEDPNDNLAEFDQLSGEMPFMLVDSATMQGTLRILEKHNLVERVASPQLVVVTGREAVFQVGTEIAGADMPFQGMRAEVKAREMGGGLAVDFGFSNVAGQQVNQVRTSLIVPTGHTVVMKTGVQPTSAETATGEENTTKPTVYVVLTPEVLRKWEDPNGATQTR